MRQTFTNGRVAQAQRRARIAAAPRLVDARCADCGGPLTLIQTAPEAGGDYFVCGIPHPGDRFGVELGCAGIRTADGVRPPFAVSHDGPF